MNLITLFSELQVNPKNMRVYRRLIERYREINMPNEAVAFSNLLEEKFGTHSTPVDEEQRTDN